MNKQFEHAGEKHEGIKEYEVLAPLNLHIGLHGPSDYFNSTHSVLGVWERGDDQVRVIAAEVVENDGEIDANSSRAIALIMSSSELIAGDMGMLRNFAIVGDVRIQGTILTAEDATPECVVHHFLLLTGQWANFAVLFEMFDNHSFPLDEFIEKLFDWVLSCAQHILLV